jgi:hypothetical protein
MSDFVKPVFDTAQAAAERGLTHSELHEVIAAMYPNRRYHVFIGSGSIKGYDHVMGMPHYMEKEGYSTVRSGWVYHVAASALAVGDIYTDVNGVTWEVVANVTRQGSAEWPGSHVFCAVEVAND